MDEASLSTDPRVVLLLLVPAVAFLLAWSMAGIAGKQGAQGAAAPQPPGPRERRVLPAPPRFDTPERRDAPIGRYMDCTIFDTVSIGGLEYRFDRVLAPGALWRSDRGERCIAPGLVYVTR